MIYYRARTDTYDPKTKNYLVRNQLITEVERKKLYPTRPDFLFKEIDIPKYRTYWSFGARFEIGTGVSTRIEEKEDERHE